MQRKQCSWNVPNGLLQISHRVYVFDSCLTLEYDWSKDQYKEYTNRIVGQFLENVQDASIMVCNFHEEDAKLRTTNNFCKHNVTVMDYPGQYQRWPVPKMEVICEFLKSCGNWLSHGEQNVLLMHCDRGGGWHVLAFMLAALLIFRKQCNGEEMALDMVYKQAPREILHLMMPLDPISSQLRYLEYVSKWNVALDWPELDRALRLDCIILRYIPNFDGKGVCQPMFRIYGQDPARADKSSNILYSMPKRAKNVRAYKQGEYELIIVDINCHVKGDVLIESINLKGDMESEQMMFHTMFNTAFLRSNILMLNRDKVDILWDAKDQFPKDFRAEILFSEMDVATAVPENGTSWFEEKEGLPVEAFSKAQEIFSNGDWMSPREDPALQQRRASDIMQEKLDASSDQYMESDTFSHRTGPNMPQEKKNTAKCFSPSNLEIKSGSSPKKKHDNDVSRKEDKNIEVDATPRQSSCPDSNTSMQNMSPKMTQKKKKEENCLLTSNLDAHSVSSTTKTQDNGMSRKEDKAKKIGATPPQPSCSDSTTSLHQTGSKLPQEKSKENADLPPSLEVHSVSSTKKSSNNGMIRKEDKANKDDATPLQPSCSDSTTSLHQTGSKLPQEKSKENADLPPSLEVHSVSSTKKSSDNCMIRKEDKANKDDATPRQPSCSDSTTSLHQAGSKTPQDKRKEENHLLPPNLEAHSVSSNKKIPDNDISRNEDKTVKVDSTLQRPSNSNSTTSHQTSPIMPQGKKKEANYIPSSNLESQSMHSTTKTPDNNVSTKQDKTIEVNATPPRSSSSDFITSSHQTGYTMPQEKKKEANCIVPPNMEVQSVSSTKQTSDNYISRKEDKTIKFDSTPQQPNSFNSTTSSQKTDPTMPQGKKKEANSILSSNLENQSAPSTKKTPDNDKSRKYDKTTKVDASPPQPSSSDSTSSSHQTDPIMPQKKKKEGNCILPSNMEVQSVSSTKQNLNKDMRRKEDEAIKVDATLPRPSSSSDSTTSFHQTGSKVPQEKEKEANYTLPSNLESKPVPSTKKSLDNDISRKEDKAIKVDATPPRPSSSDSTTSFHQTGSEMPQEKPKEANSVSPSNLESKPMPSTNKIPDNDTRSKQNKTINVDASPARSTSSDSTTSSHQTGSKMPHEVKKEANCFLPSNLEIQSVSSTKHTPDNDTNRKEDKTVKVEFALPGPDSKSLYSKQNSSECSLPSSVDTSSSDSISPQTPPPQSHVTRSAKEVHDYPPHKESSSPLKSRNLATQETKSNSQDRNQSLNFTSKNETASSCTYQNKSQTDAGSHPPASEITSTKLPPPHSPVSSPTCMKNILPVRTRLDSSPSKTQAPLSPHTPPQKDQETIRIRHPPSPPTPPPKNEKHANTEPSLSPPPPPPPPCLYRKAESSTIAPPPPPPPPAAAEHSSNSALQKSAHVPAAPAAPPPPTVYSKSGLKSDNGFPMSLSGMAGVEGRRSSPKGRTLSHIISAKNNTKKLKPLHWMKLSKAVKGSLWDETQKSDEASKAPEIDMSELENLFSAPVPSKGHAKKSNIQNSVGPKSDKVQLIDHTRAYNCEILLSKVKVPLQDLMSSVLALEESVLDTDQVENLMKFCPTKEEIEVLKGYTGEKEKLGRCEQFFLELMKVPRVESKLRVFSFKIEFHSQVSDLRNSLHVVNAASEEIRNSIKLKRIMQTILSLGNALNQGTAKGSAIGFRLDSLLKLTETRSRNNKITLMHYLCKVMSYIILFLCCCCAL
ncbi:putative C2 domain, formin, FH2 domain, protein-tyrosine phosphatase [Lupinus albus]|uniref:Putative C2 domain, formin, FH2 domain, protein-tyrosine phosphatase n=1 Tax=Lupinus albus TaxID=3870 RepID=A0A6A4PSQ8_LUPAL|nr:putative C2 domain, formin, FH2 domain, protein-tyrosine phosphatase [Lupinus albus]